MDRMTEIAQTLAAEASQRAITDDMVEQACLTYGRIMLASGKMWNPSEAGQDAMRAALEAVINPLPDRYYELTEASVLGSRTEV
jgi:hypothetical protein